MRSSVMKNEYGYYQSKFDDYQSEPQETLKELIDRIKVLEEVSDMNKLKNLARKIVAEMYKND